MTRVLILDSKSVLADLESVLAALQSADSDLVVIAGDLVINQAVLAPIVENPFAGTCAAVRRSAQGNIRVLHHQLVAAGTTFHSANAPNANSVGVLRIAVRDRDAAILAVGDLKRCIAQGLVVLQSSEVVEGIITALLRSQIPVKEVEIIDAPWFRSPADTAQAQSEVASMSEVSIRKLQANRIDDGFYSTFIVRKLSKPLTSLAIHLHMSPNLITVISFVVGLGAAAAFATGNRWVIVLGAVLLQLSLIIDCVDGEVARATRRFSVLGAWLDASTDRVKEYAAYAGLAAGAVVMGVDSWQAWTLAIVLMIVQTARHMGDYNFAAIQRLREVGLPAAALTDPTDPWGDHRSALTKFTQSNRRAPIHWIKKVIHMPIGERWLVLSVIAAIFNGYWALLTLLVLTGLAWVYTLLGRIVRTLRWSHEPVGERIIADQLDSGPIFGALGTIIRIPPVWTTSRWNWATPMLLRIAEMTLVAAIAVYVYPQWETLAFGYLFIVAFHHYDNLYRALGGSRAPRWITWSALGFEGRSVIIAVAGFLGITAFHDALNLGVAWLFMWCVVIASAQFLGAARKDAVL